MLDHPSLNRFAWFGQRESAMSRPPCPLRAAPLPRADGDEGAITLTWQHSSDELLKAM